MYSAEKYDVVVIGAGHAGIEAGLAAARLGAKTAIFTLSLDAVGNMPCNPSIGGTAKGHLVFEIDALGGEMGRAADATLLQSRMLNTGKGPAVRSLRIQSDRRAYSSYMKSAIEKQPGLMLMQEEIVAVSAENGVVTGVISALDVFYPAKCVIVATGTYLGGRIFVGDMSRTSGPDNVNAALPLTQSLLSLGIPIRRFKTGTPARVHRRSIDFSKLTRQPGDSEIVPFSFSTRGGLENKVDCYIAYTNEETHRVIRENLDRSPLYSGKIEGIGPRYCPSIEDKVVRFPEKTRHQIFVEPCGENTEEIYLQGMSSSLPFDVQLRMYKTIEGFENIEIMRPAYAIEYDCCDPIALSPDLMVMSVGGLYGAGQFNGSSGYEEAAAQGLVAGVNAARRALGQPPVILARSESYIGTLIDDLVTKGVNDPYRMMTSRSEYRLTLRQDNADRRLCELGHSVGLLTDDRYAEYLKNNEMLENELARLERARVKTTPELMAALEQLDAASAAGTYTAKELLKRPRIEYGVIAPYVDLKPECPAQITEKAVVEIKYEGYLGKQRAEIERQRRLETRLLPASIDYLKVEGLRIEAAEKLSRIRPLSLGQASRISGVNPADITVLTLWLKKNEK